MKLFFKAQFSSFIATLVDFMVTFGLAEFLQLYYLAAVAAGAISGAITNFTINRYWTFKVTEKPVRQQGAKYIMVWFGSLALNVAGVFMLTEFLNCRYMLSKVIVSLMVGFTYNYFLQKEYVFSSENKVVYK